MKSKLHIAAIIGCTLSLAPKHFSQTLAEKIVKDQHGTITLVTFKAGTAPTAEPQQIFQQILKLQAASELRLQKTETDFTGRLTDQKYQQFFRNVKVDGGVYNLHYLGGALSSMNGEIYEDETAPEQPAISAASAFATAVNSVNARRYMWEDTQYMAENTYRKPAGELVYFPVLNGEKINLLLAYKFDIYAAEPLSRNYVYIDAVNGRLIYKDPILKHAAESLAEGKNPSVSPAPLTIAKPLVAGTADTRYSGTQNIETKLSGANYILFDETRGNGVRTYNLKKSSTLSSAVEFTDNDNNWSAAEFNNANFDNAALDAHWGVGKTYDYFKTTFNRNSYDNNGTLLKSYVHYGNSYENAGWTGSEMIYGDGATRFSPLTGFDVTAHELGHGVCSSSAALLYQRESGALNEGLSDIWGAAVEYTYAPGKQTWQIGEDIMKIAPYFLRSMSNPKSGNPPQPDTYKGTFWKPATVEEGCASPNNTNDNCGVHYNSGVLNHWFYILSVGKTGTNDLGNSYNVSGIGIDKAAKIVYRLETSFLGANTNYKAARNFAIQAATELYGTNSVEAIATQDAFHAVGVGPKYLTVPDTTAPTAPTALIAKNITGTQLLLEWSPSTDEYGVEMYMIFRNGTQIATVPGMQTSYQVSGLVKNTTYTFFVKAQDPYENISDASNTVTATTANTLNYCNATSNNTNDERIKRVQIGTIDNTSSSFAGYEDFSFLSTDVIKSVPVQITITPEWTATVYDEGYAVFVDWNNDGDFTDAGETAFTKSAGKTTPIVGTITPPTTYSYTGPVRMRVMMSFGGTPSNSCATVSYGQVEDYTLNVLNPVLAVRDQNLSGIVLYPNPVKDVLSISGKTGVELHYKILTATAQLIQQGKTADHKISVEKLLPGTYILELTDAAGKNSSHKFLKK